MNRTFYLVDNNALIRPGANGSRSSSRPTARHHRRAPRGTRASRPGTPCAGRIPVTPAVLDRVRPVMRTVEVGDIGLVDLYGNKGTADPGLIASALDALAADEGKLFPDAWVIVTNDRAVEASAAEHLHPHNEARRPCSTDRRLGKPRGRRDTRLGEERPSQSACWRGNQPCD